MTLRISLRLLTLCSLGQYQCNLLNEHSSHLGSKHPRNWTKASHDELQVEQLFFCEVRIFSKKIWIVIWRYVKKYRLFWLVECSPNPSDYQTWEQLFWISAAKKEKLFKLLQPRNNITVTEAMIPIKQKQLVFLSAKKYSPQHGSIKTITMPETRKRILKWKWWNCRYKSYFSLKISYPKFSEHKRTQRIKKLFVSGGIY